MHLENTILLHFDKSAIFAVLLIPYGLHLITTFLVYFLTHRNESTTGTILKHVPQSSLQLGAKSIDMNFAINTKQLKTIKDKIFHRIINVEKVIIEFICLLLVLPSITDIIKNFDRQTYQEWDESAYSIYLFWAVALTSGVYLYEMAVLPIRTQNRQSFLNDITHWIHHLGHTFVYIGGILDIYTIHDTRLASVYSFWTYIASIPLIISMIIYKSIDNKEIRYIVCYINVYLFAIGNIIRCSSAGYFWIKYYYKKQLSNIIVYCQWPMMIIWSIDQIMTCIALYKMGKKNKRQLIQIEIEQLKHDDITIAPRTVKSISVVDVELGT